MNKYTIYCTAEQTKKARELGAPIEVKSIEDAAKENYGRAYFTGMATYAKFPTAEQMIGWLEEQEEISDLHIYKMILSWTFELYASNGDGKNEHPLFQSRKEATLAAIDAALEYLSNNKNK